MAGRGATPTILALAAALAGAAPAQAPVLDTDRATLIGARQAAAESERRAAALQEAAGKAGDEAERARVQAAVLTLRVAAAEQDMAATRARIALIDGLRARQRTRIAARQGPILHLFAALQTMARRPAGLALVQPGSMDDLVHVRLLLADTMPVVAARTAGLRAELHQSDGLRAQAGAAVDALAKDQVLLAERREELAALERTAIRRAQRLAEQAATEQQRALGLGADARDIADDLQLRQTAGDVRRALALLDGPAPRPGDGGAMPVHDGRARYRLPVAGEVANGYGEVSDAGVRARGLTVAALADAPVSAPAAGTVLFAHPFRSYGGVVILAHGGGWTTTLTGLATIAVRAGQAVRQGQTIGRAGPGRPQVTTELRRDNQPVDVLGLAQAG